jgi:translation initiation factor 1 (eIF-1/SUI1)
VTKRQSKKFITFCRGVEDYNVDPKELAKEVSRRFACSSSILDEHNTDGRAGLKKDRVELEFQGNLVDELEAFLVGDASLTDHGGAKGSPYALPKNSIRVVLRKGVPARKKRPTNKKK